MVIRFPTIGDTKIIKGYLDRLVKPEEYFDSHVVLFAVRAEEAAVIENSCIAIVKELEGIVAFCTSTTEELSADDVSPGISVNSVDMKDKSVCSLMKSDGKASYLFSAHPTLVSTRSILSDAKESLEKFNSQHGYLFSVDIALLKSVGKNQAEQEEFLMKFSANTKDRSVFTKAVATMEDSDIPSKSIRYSYHSFIQAATTVMEWISTIDAVKDRQGTLPTNGSVVKSQGSDSQKVRRYQVHNCRQIYEMFRYLFKDYYSLSSQEFCEEVSGYVLKPQFIASFRDSLEEFLAEIQNLETVMVADPSTLNNCTGYPVRPYMSSTNSIQSQLQSSTGVKSDPPIIVLNPSIHEFYFLYKTLALYLSSSIHIEGMSSTKYFEMTCNTLSKNSESILEKIKAAASSLQEVMNSNGDNVLDSSPEKTNDLKNYELLYRDLRRKIGSTINRLEADLLRVQRLFFTLDPLPSAFLGMTKDLQDLECSFKALTATSNRTSWWNSFSSFFKEVLNAATCKVEYNPLPENNSIKETFSYDDSPVIFTSTHFERKEQLLVSLKQLNSRLENEGRKVEEAYPGLFFRSQKKQILGNIDSMISVAEKYSVLFKAPSS